jgi:hypothetical protein
MTDSFRAHRVKLAFFKLGYARKYRSSDVFRSNFPFLTRAARYLAFF